MTLETQPGGSLARNVAHLTIASLASNFCLFVGNVVILAHYGFREHGLFIWHVSVILLAMCLAGLITSKAGVREIARARAAGPSAVRSTVSGLVAAQLAFSVLMSAALLALAGPLAGLKADASADALLLGASWVLLNALGQIGAMLAVGLERMVYVAIINPTAEVAKLAWVGICAAMNLPIGWLFVGWTVAYGLSALLAIGCGARLLRPYGGLGLGAARTGLRNAAKMLRQAVAYFVPFFSVFAPPLVLQIVMGADGTTGPASNAHVSMFQFCFQLALLSRVFSLSVSTALFPRMSHLHASSASDTAGLGAVLLAGEKILALLGTGVFATLATVSPLALRAYGGQGGLALVTLLILCFAVGIDNLAQQIDQVLAAVGDAAFVAWMELVKYAVIAGVALATMLPRPDLAAGGAAVALAAGLGVSLVAKLAVARRRLPDAGGGVLARMLLIFLALSAAAMAGPLGLWLQLPLWFAAAASLRLLTLADVKEWTRVALGILGKRS